MLFHRSQKMQSGNVPLHLLNQLKYADIFSAFHCHMILLKSFFSVSNFCATSSPDVLVGHENKISTAVSCLVSMLCYVLQEYMPFPLFPFLLAAQSSLDDLKCVLQTIAQSHFASNVNFAFFT